MISTYQVYSDWVTTQLKGIASKHRLYRLAGQWWKIKVDAAQWIVVYGVISHQGMPSLRKSIISKSAMAMAGCAYAFFAGVLANGDNYRHAAIAMCLAIAMYIATGILGIIQQVLSTIGVFLLTLLGKAILLVGHTVTGGDTSRELRVVSEEQESYMDSQRTRATRSSERSLKSRHSSKTIKPASAQTIPSTHETSISI